MKIFSVLLPLFFVALFVETTSAQSKCAQRTIEIGVGTPAQKLRVLFDTGSSNSWIEYSKDKNNYAPDKSSTFKKGNKRVEIEYGSGELSGVLVRDAMAIDGVAATVDFVLVDETRGEAFDFIDGVDGVIGAAFPPLAIDGTPPALHSIVRQLDEQDRYFSLHLDAEECTNTVAIGHAEAGKGAVSLELFYPQSNRPSYWSVRATQIGTRRSGNVLLADEREIIFDTGTEFTTGPTAEIEPLLKQLDIATDCSNKDKLPPLDIALDEITLSISADAYVFEDPESNECIPALYPLDLPDGEQWIMGNSVLRHIETIYRLGDVSTIEISQTDSKAVSLK